MKKVGIEYWISHSQWSQFHTVLAGTASVYRTRTLAVTRMIVFRSGLNTCRTRVIPAIPERIQDFGR